VSGVNIIETLLTNARLFVFEFKKKEKSVLSVKLEVYPGRALQKAVNKQALLATPARSARK